MAPSPAAGKPSGTPKTPTKLGKKPGSTPQKLGQPSSSAKPSTPKPSKLSKPDTDSPQLPPRPSGEEATDTAEETTEGAKDTADDAQEEAGGAAEQAQPQTEMKDDDDEEGPMSKVTKAGGDTEDDLEQQEPEPVDDDAVGGAEEQAKETAEGAEDDATEKAGKIGDSTDDATDEHDQPQEEGGDLVDKAGDTAEKPTDGVEEAAEGAEETGEDGVDEAQKVPGTATDETGDTADGVEETAEGAAEGAEETAEDATDGVPQPPEGLPLDLSVLKGLEVAADGHVYDSEENAVGKLAEGDAEDLEGYEIGDEGEILDEDGDLVGRVELLPTQIKKQLEDARGQGEELPEGAEKYLDELEQYGDGVEEDDEDGPQLPPLSILEGLSCQVDGLIYDADGNTIGKVVDGDPQDLQSAVLNGEGEFVDEEGNVVGHAEIHEDAADLVAQGIYAAAPADEGELADGVEDQVDGAVEDGVEGADGAVEDAGEPAEGELPGIEDELPGIEALEGRPLNQVGEIVDDEGNILGAIEDEELKQKILDGEIDPNTLKINDAGEVVDEDGNVLGKTELADGAAEILAGGPILDPRILDGKKINKKGKILDEDGEEIGELRDGELSECAGKKVNDKGEVLDKQGNVIGHVNVVPGEASENATKALLEELGELPEDEADAIDLSIFEGLKVNKKGKILDEDGEEIGQLVDGELEDCAGKKCNDKGEVLDKDGNVVGRVSTIPKEAEEGLADEVAEEEDGGPELPPLSILEGLTVNKAGKLVDANGAIVGELIEGDAKKLSKSGITCDDEGQFWDTKGHVIGRAQTLPQDEPEEEALFAGLEGLHVVEDGFVEDENGNKVGIVVEGDAKMLIGREVDEDGDIIDKKGSVVGHAERWAEEEQEEEAPEEVDLSFLAGKTINKNGNVIGDEGIPVARLIEGNAKELAGLELDDQGQIWNNKGQVIGRVELIPLEDREAKPEGPFAGLEGLRVIEDGKIADEDDNVVGEIVEGNPKRLIGLAVDEDGDILDRYGNVKGHAEPLPDVEEEEIDNSILNGKALNKQGFVVDENGVPLGRLIEGDAGELAGRKCDENGFIYNDTGKVVGRCEVIPEDQRVARGEGPFAGLEGLRVVKDGWVEDEDGNRVGQLVEGNEKRLVGLAVDEDGDIIDKYGNVKGHAEPWEEEEAEAVDLSALAGCTINKSGNAVDGNGQIIGRVVEGDLSTMIGKKVDGLGQIWDNAGNVVGRCELVLGEDTSPEGPFAGFEGLVINKDETVTTPAGDIIGRIIEGDIKKLMGHTVDEDGDIVDKNGNTIGKAERWEPEEKVRNINPMSGRRVNSEGEVRDENGDLMGKLTMGDLGHCVGQEVDDAGNVVDVDGNKIGEVTLLANIADDYEGPTEEEIEEARKREEEREIAQKMAGICSQTLEKVQPICKSIKDYMDKADATPKEELDEEELVDNVKPLIEEAGRILQECNGSLRGLDPDGRIAAQAKGRAGTGEATPEEFRLAEVLKELTTTVVTTVDDAKKKLNNMPHAKKKLNPLWGLMTQPLFQILAAVGLLLAGVLGLVGQLLSGLGLGGLVNGLMGGLGINKLLESFGIGGGEKKKKKKSGGGLSSLPVVGGLLGGGK